MEFNTPKEEVVRYYSGLIKHDTPKGVVLGNP